MDGGPGDRAGLAAAHDLVAALAARGVTVVTAESLTGGGLGAMITAVPGASAVYRGGVVAYATELKLAVLGVPPDVVETSGVVSAECAEAMAVGARRALGGDLAMSTTGVAGPETQEGQPVGRVYVALAGDRGTVVRRLDLSGDRAQIRAEACARAAETAREHWSEVVGWTNT